MALQRYGLRAFQVSILLTCLWVIYIAFCQSQIIDGDYWWYLASGKVIASGHIPRTNSFSFTAADFPWAFTQWLFAVSLYAATNIANQHAVEFFFLSILCATFILTLDTIRQKVGAVHLLLALPLLMIAVQASSIRFIIRPHLVSLFFLALLLNLLGRRTRRLKLYCFLVGLFWANLHAGFVFGLVTCAVAAAGSHLSGDRDDARLYCHATLWFFAGTLLNANFLQPYYYVISNLWVTRIVPVAEMASIWGQSGDQKFQPFWLLSVLFAILLPLLIKRRDYSTTLLFLLFFPLALFAVRIIPKMLLLTLPGCTVALMQWLAERRRRVVVGSVLLWGALLLTTVASGRFVPVSSWGVSPAKFPLAAADFVATKNLQGRMYNGFDEGGYLAYRFFPERRVFVDGRVQAFPPTFLKTYYRANRPSYWQALMEKYDISFALVRRQITGDRETFNRGVFFRTMGWPLIHLDGRYLIYARPGSGNDAVIENNRFQLIDWNLTADDLKALARRSPSIMRSELERLPASSLVLESDFVRFSDAAYYTGDLNLCESFLQSGLDRLPGAYGLRLKLAVVHAAAGRLDQARQELLKLVDEADSQAIAERAVSILGRIGSQDQERL